MDNTGEKILRLLQKCPLSPAALAFRIGVSRQALHRRLKVLVKIGQIEKQGFGPHVKYVLKRLKNESRVQESFIFFRDYLLPRSLKNQAGFNSNLKILKGGKLDFGFMLDAASVYSSNIEGNTLNLNSFLNSRHLAKKLRPKDAQEIEDLVDAYHFSQKHPLGEKNMLHAHAMLGKKFINKARLGTYRREPVGVFSVRGMEYLAIEAEFVKHEMHQLFTVIPVLLKKSCAPLEVFFWASWLHLMIAMIHSFADGNGRIARLSEKWFLVQKLGQEMFFLRSEEYYYKNRGAYYAGLRLGVNYWEADFSLAESFVKLLPAAMEEEF